MEVRRVILNSGKYGDEVGAFDKRRISGRKKEGATADLGSPWLALKKEESRKRRAI
jgi:hypothetical protein